MCVELHANKTETVLQFAAKTSHESNVFLEAVHGTQTVTRKMRQTQIETNTGVQLRRICAPSNLLGTPHVSPRRETIEVEF